jgi:hypothetical protein
MSKISQCSIEPFPILAVFVLKQVIFTADNDGLNGERLNHIAILVSLQLLANL